MKNPDYYFEKIYAVSGVFTDAWQKDGFLVPIPEGDFYRVRSDAAFREQMMRKSDEIRMPFFHEDEQHVWMICAGFDDEDGHGYVFLGPVCFQRLDTVSLHRYYYAAGRHG